MPGCFAGMLALVVTARMRRCTASAPLIMDDAMVLGLIVVILCMVLVSEASEHPFWCASVTYLSDKLRQIAFRAVVACNSAQEISLTAPFTAASQPVLLQTSVHEQRQ